MLCGSPELLNKFSSLNVSPCLVLQILPVRCDAKQQMCVVWNKVKGPQIRTQVKKEPKRTDRLYPLFVEETGSER